MAKKLKVGDRLRGYRVTKAFGPGAMAISYAAEAADGRRIFLKQYKSPSPTVVWYGPFIDYQQELTRRVRDGKAAMYAVKLVDAFEETWGGPTYFQAYEFIADGGDLQHILEEERERHRATGVAPARDPAVWARHVTWAKVFMAGIAALHESRVVHADLKPPNVFLLKDASIAAGYQVKLIDTDFSLLSDQRAPWHGFQGYVGSDNYRSPEHMTKGATPTPASDVFTCGLILWELLVGTHPYWQDDQAEYARLVRAHAAKPPALQGVMPAPATNAEVSGALYRCLSPDPAKRPTAAELRAALSGRGAKATTAPAATATPKPAAAAGREPSTRAPEARAENAAGGRREPLTAARIRLTSAGGQTLDVGVRTELGKHLVRQLGDDAQFWDARQCVLERAAGGWQVAPVAGTPNETLLNGEVLTAATALADGDVLAVGRKAKGIVKLPLTVRAAG